MSDMTRTPRREFIFSGSKLADPDPSMTPEAVKQMYASTAYPGLTNASISGPEVRNGRNVYTFKQAVGTKG